VLTHFAALFHQYGLAAVFVLLLLENFGFPLPGEAVLLYAGYQMRADQVHASAGWASWGFPELLIAGSAACIVGETAGYILGRYFGPWARRGLRISGRHRVVAEAYFQKHGPLTIFLARFVAGLRFLAAPIAGLHRMPWRPFMIYNVLGALAWVVVISELGVELGRHGAQLAAWLGRADAVALVIALVLIALAWRHLHHQVNYHPSDGGWHDES